MSYGNIMLANCSREYFSKAEIWLKSNMLYSSVILFSVSARDILSGLCIPPLTLSAWPSELITNLRTRGI